MPDALVPLLMYLIPHARHSLCYVAPGADLGVLVLHLCPYLAF
jgi:hypothetical protein